MFGGNSGTLLVCCNYKTPILPFIRIKINADFLLCPFFFLTKVKSRVLGGHCSTL